MNHIDPERTISCLVLVEDIGPRDVIWLTYSPLLPLGVWGSAVWRTSALSGSRSLTGCEGQSLVSPHGTALVQSGHGWIGLSGPNINWTIPLHVLTDHQERVSSVVREAGTGVIQSAYFTPVIFTPGGGPHPALSPARKRTTDRRNKTFLEPCIV